MADTKKKYMLRAQGVKRAFPVSGGKFWALKGINADIPTAALTILKGRSGSGKTTLLNILAALDKPTSGSVLLDGKDFSKIKESDVATFRRDNLGFVFQEFNLLVRLARLICRLHSLIRQSCCVVAALALYIFLVK